LLTPDTRHLKPIDTKIGNNQLAQSSENGNQKTLERHVVLVSPEIHWNTGNIGRTCVATGSHLHLIRPLGFSLDSKEVKRAGLDYWKQVKLHVWEDFEDLHTNLAPRRHEVALFSKTGKWPFWSMPSPPRLFLIFGSETRGLPASIVEVSGGHLPYSHHQRYTFIKSFHGCRHCPVRKPEVG
jgi:tRNA (cytidine/uridine-2'-O-)-methyltransferase